MQEIAIVIPCYNESGRLDIGSYLSFIQRHRNVHLIFVNDGSQDETLKNLAQLAAIEPLQIEYIDLGKNSGKAEAVRQGFLRAFELGASFIGYWDADLATPLSAIEKFYEILDTSRHVNFVLGSRVRLLGRTITRNAYRHILGRIFATFASLILGIPVYDTQCGSKLFRNTELLRRAFSTKFKVNWIFDVEIIARFIAFSKNYAVARSEFERTTVEYPLEVWCDIPGSRLRFMDFPKSALELVGIYFFLRSHR